MDNKATFSPKTSKPNSSDHNSRRERPKYLIETALDFDENYYETISPYVEDEQFIELAKIIYNEKFIERTGQNQPMQKTQVKVLIKEVVITVDEHQTKEDIIGLFKMLKKEKKENNDLKKLFHLYNLQPFALAKELSLPKKLKIKRKPKKENLNETGYHILELSKHADEGHFERQGKWEGLPYYPGRHIVCKSDGNWYIKYNEFNEEKREELFDILADMSEYKKVYNYHWHVKFTHFNLQTGLSASFSKAEVSGNGRLKLVAEYLGLRYAPEEKIPIEQSVRSVKEQHHKTRQLKYENLMSKLGMLNQINHEKEKTTKRELALADRVTKGRGMKKNNTELKNSLNYVFMLLWPLVQEVKSLTELLEHKDNQLKKEKDEIKSLKNQLEKKDKVIKEKIARTDEGIKSRDGLYDNLLENYKVKENEIKLLQNKLDRKDKLHKEKMTRANERIEGRNTLYDQLLEKYIDLESKTLKFQQMDEGIEAKEDNASDIYIERMKNGYMELENILFGEKSAKSIEEIIKEISTIVGSNKINSTLENNNLEQNEESNAIPINGLVSD